MKKFFLISLFCIFSFVFVFLLTAVLHEYSPETVERVERTGVAQKKKTEQEFTVVTWNLGYGGLGKDSDFFMDGGVSSKPENRSQVERNLAGIKDTVTSLNSDIFLFQEVDRASNRSFNVDELKLLNKYLPNFELFFAFNFKVFMVPVPFYDPIEKVHSGIVTGANFKAENAERYSLPSVDSWPEKLFHLKRCMLVSRYKIKDRGKELVVINIHLSAYDDGTIRSRQMRLLREFAQKEFKKGNSVIIGGDWNQRMPGVEKDQFGKYTTDEKYLLWAQKIDGNWTPKGWKWGFDDKVPTVRNNESAYRKGVNFTTIIDGFLVSPNVDVLDVRTINLGFEFSDHNPVIMKVKLSGGKDENN